jgi:hypothetical protein
MIGDQQTDKLAAHKSKLYFEFPKKDFFRQIKSFTK